jgi:hypothetical protein
MIAAPLLALLLATVPAQDVDPHRQFDFWVGEWSVQNRHLQPDGTWKDGDATLARITPVCGERAILEEWAGPFRGTFMNGFSLRAWDPSAERWALLLFWTTDGNSAFGRLDGSFRHGRGEFFVPGTGPERTRYTFSDALADSVRWDSATTKDGGQTWRTDWIMEFRRTRPAAEVTQDNLFAVDWTEGEVSPHAEARRLDWMVGHWRGSQVDAAGEEREARLRCKLLAKDCLVLDVLETRDAGGSWSQALAVRGFEARGSAWAAWSLTADDTRLVRASEAGGTDWMVFEHPHPERPGTVQQHLIRIDEGQMRIEEVFLPEDGDPEPLRTTMLERVR